MAILLGLLRGATLFLPISSSGHQAIIENILKLDYPAKNGLFELLMNLSTLISIVMVYRKELVNMIGDSAEFIRGGASDNPMSDGRLSPTIRMIYFIIVGTLPLVLAIPINKEWKSVQLPRLFVQAQTASPSPQPVPSLLYAMFLTT